MTKEKKSEFTLRISHANKTELIIVLYDIAITYIQDALSDYDDGNLEEAATNGRRAIASIEEMQNNLHFEYDLAKKLKQLYLYMKKQLRAGVISGDYSGYNQVCLELISLRDAYEQIKDNDKSEPVMKNTQTVLSGMTYSRNRLLESLTTECYSSRGFKA